MSMARLSLTLSSVPFMRNGLSLSVKQNDPFSSIHFLAVGQMNEDEDVENHWRRASDDDEEEDDGDDDDDDDDDEPPASENADDEELAHPTSTLVAVAGITVNLEAAAAGGRVVVVEVLELVLDGVLSGTTHDTNTSSAKRRGGERPRPLAHPVPRSPHASSGQTPAEASGCAHEQPEGRGGFPAPRTSLLVVDLNRLVVQL